MEGGGGGVRSCGQDWDITRAGGGTRGGEEHLLCYISMQMNELIITGKGDQREEAYKN